MTKTPDKVGPWRVTEQSVPYDNPWIQVRDHNVIHPDGSPGQYGTVHFKANGVGVLPLDHNGKVWMVGQHRFPLNAYSWEVPEGGSPLGEAPLETAKRELAEETGLKAEQWHSLFKSVALSNSVSDERGWGYLAFGLTSGQSHPEASEELEVEQWPFPLLLARVLSGDVSDSVTQLITLSALVRAQQGELPSEICELILSN